ncbi:hypothetical protein GF337_04405 [candidate division KSB1 bacterium]|nr:hypothetical protein [candidate division KSB1 bacterium]
MHTLTLCYILNATLLLLHEIESAYEKKWEILKLPGKITGFLLMHIPIILLFFYGAIEIENVSTAGMIIGTVFGVAGILPFLVHKFFIRKPELFNLPISNVIIYLNIVTGALLSYFSIQQLFHLA